MSFSNSLWNRFCDVLGRFWKERLSKQEAKIDPRGGLGGVLGRLGSSGGVLGRPGRVWEASGDGFGRLSGAILGGFGEHFGKFFCNVFPMSFSKPFWDRFSMNFG